MVTNWNIEHMVSRRYSEEEKWNFWCLSRLRRQEQGYKIFRKRESRLRQLEYEVVASRELFTYICIYV